LPFPDENNPAGNSNRLTRQYLKNKRDVYYILMDSYASQELLLDEFGFRQYRISTTIRDLGFVMPECSISNYDATPFSLSSSLNMTYLDDLGVYPGQIVDR